MNQWKNDLSISRNLFINFVWPNIKIWFPPESKLIQVEEVQDSYAELLDKEAGIDYLIKDKVGLRPISARVQQNYEFKTLTIREKRSSGVKTEFEKLVKRVNSNYLHPWIHIQAYIKFNKLIRAYGVETRDLVHLLDFKDDNVWYREINKNDGNIFLVFKISGLENYGIKIMKFEKSNHP